jgi:two-component system sensor kinase FixL
MRKITLIQKFSILCLAVLVLFGIVFGWIITTSLEHNILDRSKKVTAIIVSEEVQKELADTDLITPKMGSEFDAFAERVKHLSLGPDIVRIKVWNKGQVVVWSDEKRLVGQRFPDNEELKGALNGEITSEISTLKKSEQKFERQFKRLLELYVPIRFNGKTDIETVFEIYQNLDHLYADISHLKSIVWTSVISGFVFLYLILFGIVWRASRHIEAQTKEIVQSEERYRSLVRSAHDGIVAIDRKGKVILFNEAAAKMFGYSPEEVIGQPLTMLLPEQYITKHIGGVSRFFETGETTLIGKTIEMEGSRRDGQAFPVELSLSASGVEDSLIVTEIIRDISERKAIQEQLINAEKQASVSIIAGSIGHELNNVISALMGYAQLLMRKSDDKKLAKESAEVFSTQTQRLKIHASNLLSLSKPQEPEMKPMVLNSLLDKVTDLLFVSGLLKQYTIVKEYSEDLPLVLGDEMLLEQVVRNLEINAAHAMDNQGILTVNTKFSEDNSHVEFSITDTGHGIPNDRRHQIFLPFYTTKEKGKGTGLGMYIVKQIVEQHKGYIQLKSEVGVGTAVTIGLPIMKG